MPRHAKGVSQGKIDKGRPGRYGDGGGLYLCIKSKAVKHWLFRYVPAGAKWPREMGLGAAHGRDAVSLSDARKKARELWEIHRAGRDPLAERRAGRMAIAAASIGSGRTFKQAAIEFIELHRGAWRNARHALQWEVSLTDYVYPAIGALSVDVISTAHVAALLTPIWTEKPETASRIRGRIEQVLGREKALGHRSGENPARWKENLASILPRHSKVKRIQHYAAMPARELGDFMAKLRADDSVIARALEFLVLTCTRTVEVRGARWGEIDLDAKVWTIPAERMKAGREHRVPLSSRAVEIVHEMQARHVAGDFVFAGRSSGASLLHTSLLKLLREMGIADATVHGFRSTFGDWASASTSFASEVAELMLAHTVGDETERAYRRGDLLEKRFQLAEAWAEFCARPSIDGGEKVIPIRGGKK
jgi:integrase